MNKNTKLIYDLLKYKKYSKLCNKWVDWNFGYWGDAPDWANTALDKCRGISDNYPTLIDAYYASKVNLYHWDSSDLEIPTFVRVGYDEYEYHYKIKEKCKKMGISYDEVV